MGHMSTIEIVFLALALSIDAFAVSLSAAATGRAQGVRATFRLAFHFGLFQFLMPVLGWSAGHTLEPLIAAYDHWITFGLLGLIGIRMIRASLGKIQEEGPDDPSRGLTLLALSIATSIDALAVGLSLAILRTDIWWPSFVIGIVTGTVCLIAIRLGRRLNGAIGRRAEFVGGVILIVIAIRILLSHTL